MDLTHLPTDNLYKFLALSGLAMIGFAIALFYRERRSALDRLRTLELELCQARSDVKYAKRSFEALRDTSPPTPEDRDKVEVRLRDLEAQTAKLTVEGTYLDHATNDLLRLRRVMGVLVAIGTLLAIAGFYFWYVRVQRFLDVTVSTAPSAAVSGSKSATGVSGHP